MGVLPALTALTGNELEARLDAFLAERGEPAFRTAQIVSWVYDRFARSFETMSNLPRRLREALEAGFRLHGLRVDREVMADDGSCKTLLVTHDAFPVESVCLPVSDGATYCLSVSSGCPLGCAFCVSGKFFNRQLSAGEIVDQYLLMRHLRGDDPPFSGIVLMGMGESFLNWKATSAFLETLRDRCGVGARRITVSTVGVPDGIEALGRQFPQVKLAVSLHAARNDLRRRIMPYAAKASLSQIMAACRQYAAETHGRRITFEYILLAGVNDAAADARDLAMLLSGLPAAINLIPFNPYPGAPFERPDDAAVARFKAALCRQFRGAVTIRRSLGSTAAAACGQLGLGHGTKD